MTSRRGSGRGAKRILREPSNALRSVAAESGLRDAESGDGERGVYEPDHCAGAEIGERTALSKIPPRGEAGVNAGLGGISREFGRW